MDYIRILQYYGSHALPVLRWWGLLGAMLTKEFSWGLLDAVCLLLLYQTNTWNCHQRVSLSVCLRVCVCVCLHVCVCVYVFVCVCAFCLVQQVDSLRCSILRIWPLLVSSSEHCWNIVWTLHFLGYQWVCGRCISRLACFEQIDEIAQFGPLLLPGSFQGFQKKCLVCTELWTSHWNCLACTA